MIKPKIVISEASNIYRHLTNYILHDICYYLWTKVSVCICIGSDGIFTSFIDNSNDLTIRKHIEVTHLLAPNKKLLLLK